MNKLILAAFVATMCFSLATGLDCYVCGRTTIGGVTSGDNCLGPNPDSSFLITCPTGSTHCQTAVTKTSLLGVETVGLARTCATTQLTGCISISLGETCYHDSCTTDGCNTSNGSEGMKINMLAMLMALVVGFLFSKF